MTKLDRVYKIELMIRNRGHVSFKTMLEELEVSKATLKRDLEYLRDRLDAPIVYDRDVNGYVFAKGQRGPRHELPGLWFDERELYSLLMAHQLFSELDTERVLSRHLQPLIEKIHQLLGPDEADAKALLKRVKIITAVRRPVQTRVFEQAAESLLKRRRLGMRYHTRSRDVGGEREVSPQRLVHYRNTWYLDAWCHRSDALRRFSLDAMDQVQLLESKARDVAMRTLEAAMDIGYGIFAGGERKWARLRFDAQAAAWVSREEWHPEQRGTFSSDGSYELELPYADPTEIAMDILRHGTTVEVMGPAALRAEVARRLRQALAKYEGDSP